MKVQWTATFPKPEQLAKEVAIQAELLALNFALEGTGAERACSELRALSREIQAVVEPPEPRPAVLRLKS